jgi:hypothetical protein
MTVFLVEVTTVMQLVDRLKKGKYRSSQDVLAKSGLIFLALLLTKLISCNSAQAVERRRRYSCGSTEDVLEVSGMMS